MSVEINTLFDSIIKQWEKLKGMDKTPQLKVQIEILEQKILTKSWDKHADELKILNQELSSYSREIQEFQDIATKIQDIKEMWAFLKDESDEIFLEDFLQELQTIQKGLEKRELYLLFNGQFDRASCYLSLNAGAGGTESNDWAAMLLRMYLRWAEDKGFSIEIVDELVGEEAGIKSITIFLRGDFAYGYLKGEQGVHRLVRISPFDTNKKRHTSFASVSIYPEITEDINVNINPVDIRVDTFRASGAGGQHVNKTESAIRIVHIPTGITVSCQQERSQHKNRDLAMKILKSRLFTYYQEQKEQELEYLKADKKDISWGSQIRSYVFHPYKLIKDTRTQLEIGNVDKVMDGYLDPLLFEYLKWQYTNQN